jgi:predicted RecB family nuclease
MATILKSLRICPNGHRYYKSSDCPTCPVCAQEAKPTEGFMAGLSAPAQRALAGAGITTLQQLAKHSEASILQLHGMGPASLPRLRQALKDAGLAFASNKQKK